MADTKLAKVGITVKESWKDDISYEVLDYTLWRVQDGGDGCGYIAKRANIGVVPNSDDSVWIKATQAGQSIYDLAVKYGHFVGTEEEFEAEYQAALQAARDAASETSATNAEIQEAEELRRASEDERADAEAARQESETAREATESDRQIAENMRQMAETQRGENETTRQSQETARESSETQRQSNESTRQSNETARESAEQERTADFEALKTDMETAIGEADAATAAAVALNNQVAGAESARQQAEQSRVAAETARETAEAARVAAEALRVTAEGSRETAEAAREAQASADHTVAAGDHTQAAADHTQAAADHTTAASDHTQAGADHTLAAADHVTAGEDHAQAQDDHEVMAGYDTRLGNVEEEVSQLRHEVDDISTGKYYGYFAQEEDLPEADVDGFAYVGEGPTYTIYNLRNGEWTSSEITVNQSPIGNEEDIDQNEDGKLQFANRVYNAQQPNGMGYKILRKDASFASQVTDTNTIYEIRYDFHLEGASVLMPDGCSLKFNGGGILDGTISGKVLNCELRPEYFGAIGDGTEDDSAALGSCLALAMASGSTVVLDGAKTYKISTSKSFVSGDDVIIIGNGATLAVTNSASLEFHNPNFYSGQLPSNITRGDTSITFQSLPTGIVEGDIINILSTQEGESSYHTKRQQTTRVGKISGNTVYLTDKVVMDYSAQDTTVTLCHPKYARMDNISLSCSSGRSLHHLWIGQYIPILSNIRINGTGSSYGIVLNNCMNGVVRDSFVSGIQYGYLVNTSSHIRFDGVHSINASNHPVAIGSFSNYITVERATGLGAIVESHTGFNISFKDCEFGCSSTNPWTMRAVGASLERCRVFSYDGSKVQPVLLMSVSLYDSTIYNDYGITLRDCDFAMDNLQPYRGAMVDIEGCKFLPNTNITFGASSSTYVKKARIFRCENITSVSFFTNSFSLESDQERFDAVLDNGVYNIRFTYPPIVLRARNAEWGGHGYLTEVDTTASLKLPIKLMPQLSSKSETGARNMYINFDFTVFAANRASTISYAEKTFRAVIIYSPNYNVGKVLRVDDLSPNENNITASVTDFAYSGGTANPAAQAISFTLNIANTIASSSAARMSVVYDCKIVGREW